VVERNEDEADESLDRTDLEHNGDQQGKSSCRDGIETAGFDEKEGIPQWIPFFFCFLRGGCINDTIFLNAPDSLIEHSIDTRKFVPKIS
jgi:hypothetical protein